MSLNGDKFLALVNTSGVSSVSEELLASQEGLCSRGLVS
jgi:hypothetical protein